MLLKIGVAAMKVPRLGLQVNYTQDSSRHNNNAENNEFVEEIWHITRNISARTGRKKELRIYQDKCYIRRDLLLLLRRNCYLVNFNFIIKINISMNGKGGYIVLPTLLDESCCLRLILLSLIFVTQDTKSVKSTSFPIFGIF